MSYKDKLIQFNQTEKYRNEMAFIKYMLDARPGETILDFGAGIGTLVNFLSETTDAKILGHDQHLYFSSPPAWYRGTVYFPLDKVVFMHSLAHIGGIDGVLQNLHSLMNNEGRVCVITPNKEWIDAVGNTNSDETVINHYTKESLIDLFERNGFEIFMSGQFGKNTSRFNERLFLIATKCKQ